jgi:hypothetical protein
MEVAMGEDFIEQKNRQFKRCMDAAYEDHKAENLFSAVSADTISEVVGFLMADAALAIGDQVMQAGESDSGITFYRGKTPVVQLAGESATVAAQAAGEAGTPLTADVVAVSPDDGLVTLRLHQPYKH